MTQINIFDGYSCLSSWDTPKALSKCFRVLAFSRHFFRKTQGGAIEPWSKNTRMVLVCLWASHRCILENEDYPLLASLSTTDAGAFSCEVPQLLVRPGRITKSQNSHKWQVTVSEYRKMFYNYWILEHSHFIIKNLQNIHPMNAIDLRKMYLVESERFPFKFSLTFTFQSLAWVLLYFATHIQVWVHVQKYLCSCRKWF